MSRTICLIAIVLLAPSVMAGDWPMPRGPYLGQQPPGDDPELFAPGLINTPWGDRDLVISPDGDEIWYGILDRVAVGVRVTRLEGGAWTEPVFAPFSRDPEHGCLEPAFSADGRRLYFLSTLPIEGEPDHPGWGNQNIFMVDRTADGWSEPMPAPDINTTDNEYFPSLTRAGTMYFTRSARGMPARIHRARPAAGGFDVPEPLPDHVNRGRNSYNAFIDPDERYLIVCIGGDPENLGPADYWIAFRDADDSWSPAVNLGPTVNGPGRQAASAWVSPDGYLFFSSTITGTEDFFPEGRLTAAGLKRVHGSPRNGASDIYWMKADFLEGLRPDTR